MDWLRASAEAIRTPDGRHSVCRIGLGGRTVYEAWRTRAHPAGPSLLATGLATAEEARARCLDDALTAAAVQP